MENEVASLEEQTAKKCVALGIKYVKEKNFELAIQEFTQAIKVNPNCAEAYIGRGFCYREQKNYKLAFIDYNEIALIDYNKAIELNPENSETYINRGSFYNEIGNYELALIDYNKAIELNPENSEAYSNRGSFYNEIENYELALIDYNKAIELNPENSETYINRGFFYNGLGNYELALIDYNKAIELNPSDVNPYIYRADCYQQQGDYESALDTYNEVIRLNPSNSCIYFHRANYYRQQKYYQFSLNDYNEAIRLNPDDAYFYNGRACLYQEQKYYQFALNDYNEAIRLNPDEAYFYIGRGICYEVQKYYESALNDYNEAIRLDRDFIKFCSDFTKMSRDNKSSLPYYIDLINLNGELNVSGVDSDKFYDFFNHCKEICFLISNNSIIEKNYQKARDHIEKAFEYLDTDSSSEELRHKQVYLIYIDNAEELDRKNQKLEEKNKELNNLIAMFAHNFLGTLQCIRSNAEHDNNAKIHLKTVKMMSGALTAFSIISADDDKLIEQLKQDNTGETNLLQNLANNLALAVSQLLSKTNKDKIINLYLNYLRKTNQIETDTSSEELGKNKDYRKKWQALQHQWEDEFNTLFSENVELSSLQTWLADNFFPVQITGFNDYNIRFKEYGITDSIFLVVFMEILVNALKYMDVSQNQPLILTLSKQDQHYHLICENPSSQETYRGTHKGMDFLKSIARKLNAQFITESTEQQFKTTFIIPAELLD